MHRINATMPRAAALLFLPLLALLPAAAARAQHFDLQVSLEGPDTVKPGEAAVYRGRVTNAGPERSTEYLFHFGAGWPLCYYNTTQEPLAPGASHTFECSVTAQAPPYRFDVVITAHAPLDAEASNNQRSKAVTVLTPPDLVVSYPAAALVMPATAFSLTFPFSNISAATATGVRVTISGPAILEAPPNCTAGGGRAVCDAGTLGPGASGRVTLRFLAPDLSEHEIAVTSEIAANEPDADPTSNRVVSRSRTYRTFFVTNTGDAGSGSLRAAIEGANGCNSVYPCAVAFRIPPAAGERWQTIRVDSPLPRVTAAQLQLDGTTQRTYFGDTNPLGPEIEISGSPAAGSGIEMATPCESSIRGLAINGFPGAGVRLTGSIPCSSGPRVLAGNYIGTDPTGTRAVPNGRGVEVDVGAGVPWVIAQNVISGNRRSGIFIQSGPHMRISGNVIGLDAAVTAPLGNGASGVYLGTAARATDLADNYIGFNGDFGVAIARGTEYIALDGNSFQANRQQAIDYGLDGAVSDEPVPIPVITAVRVEEGVTVIEGEVSPERDGMRISVYANDAPDESGYGEGQYYLGTSFARSDGRFTFRYQGDLRGKWIAATATRYVSRIFRALGDEPYAQTTTSEFSRAVEVR